jgi:hypothetical protein
MCAHGGVNVLSRSLVDPTERIMYAGMDNIIQIEGLQANKQVRVTLGKHTGKCIDSIEQLYLFKPTEIGNHTLKICERNKCMLKCNYQVLHKCNIVFRFAHIGAESITIQQALLAPSIYISGENCEIKFKAGVKQFCIAALRGGDTLAWHNPNEGCFYPEIAEFNPNTGEITITQRHRSRDECIAGATLLEYHLKTISKLQQGDRLLFYNIVLSTGTGEEQASQTLQYYIN